jgi:hypothetical protein
MIRVSKDGNDIDYYEHSIKQGNDCPLVVEITTPNGFDGSGSDFVFTMNYGETSILWSVANGNLSMTVGIDPDTSLPLTAITIPFTPAFTRTLPVGRLTNYELERHVAGGEQKTYLEGILVVRKGINVD